MTREMLPDLARLAACIAASLAYSYFLGSRSAALDVFVMLTIGWFFRPAAEGLYRKREAWRQARYEQQRERERRLSSWYRANLTSGSS